MGDEIPMGQSKRLTLFREYEAKLKQGEKIMKIEQLRTATGEVLEATRENLILAAESIGSACMEIFLEDGAIIVIGKDYENKLIIRIKGSHPMH